MSKKEFYEWLAIAGNRMVWSEGMRKQIRGRFRYSKYKYRCFCPVTAIAMVRNRKYFSEFHVEEAGEFLGLSADFTSSIARASDGCGSKKVRKHIKEVVNLA